MLLDTKPRIAKPSSQQLELDRSHPLARGLEFAVIFDGGGTAVDLVHGYGSTPTNSPVTSTVAVAGKGSGCDFPNGGSAYQAFAGTVSDTPYLGAITLLWCGVIRTGTAYRQFMQKTASNGAANDPFEFRYDQTNRLFLSRAGASSFNSWVDNTHTIPLGVKTTVAVTQDGVSTDNGVFYVDGSSAPSIFSGAANSFTITGGSQPIWIGRRQDGVVQMDGVCLHAYAWSRVLSDAEAAWITREPYAFVRPKTTKIFLPHSSGGSAFRFRRTLSHIGTRTSSRQVA